MKFHSFSFFSFSFPCFGLIRFVGFAARLEDEEELGGCGVKTVVEV